MTQHSLFPNIVPNEKRPSGRVFRNGTMKFDIDIDDTPGIDFKGTKSVGGCEHPIQLSGSSTQVNTDGEVSHADFSAYASCKTRRATRCEACSQIYQHDARHLIAAGLRGGKGVDEEVAEAPALFVTFTAPSFGAVHSVRNGQQCRPRRDGGECKHGNQLACWQVHDDKNEQLGQPICPDCYDYEGSVLWNNAAPALWRVTRINISREIAKRLGLSVKASRELVRTEYVKVAEFQQRGLVHFHIAIRLDSDGLLNEQALTEVVKEAAQRSEVEAADGERVTWGNQLDIKPIKAEDFEDQDRPDVSRRQVANYLAKYATKGSDVEGKLDRRFKNEDELRYLNVNDHLARMVRTSWKLTGVFPAARLDAWSHQLGFRGHFLTKSRNWSTTFKALRQVRKDHQEELRKASWDATNDNSLIITKWAYAGAGYRSPIDAQIAEAIRNEKAQQRIRSKAA